MAKGESYDDDGEHVPGKTQCIIVICVMASTMRAGGSGSGGVRFSLSVDVNFYVYY